MKELRKVVILHDVDGRVYFSAIEKLNKENKIQSICYRETYVFRKFISIFYRNKFSLEQLNRNFKNLFFRFTLPFLRNNVVIFGTAPYDIRFIFYSLLLFRNTIIYHTSWPYWWGDNIPHTNKWTNKIMKKIYLKVLNMKNFHYVCLTDPVKKSFQSELGDNNLKKISVIPHAVDLKLFKSEPRVKKVDDIINVLFVGRLVKEKGVYEICELVSRLDPKKFKINIVGSGQQENYMKQNLENRENVKFYGHISNKSKLSDIFKGNDVLILPSKKIDGWEELFGLVIIEAMASGLLVIASNHIGPRGIIDNMYNGILIDDNDLVNGIYSNLITYGSSKGNDMRFEATRIVDKYSIERIAEQWMDVIGE